MSTMRLDENAMKAVNRAVYNQLVGASDGGTYVVPAATQDVLRRAITAYLQALSPGSTGEAEGCGPISDEPLEALSHARSKAANDDTSLPGTVERKRHCQRLAAMQSATAEIVKLRALLSVEGLRLGSRLTVDGVEAVVVPVEPTHSQKLAGSYITGSYDIAHECYRRCLSAAGER